MPITETLIRYAVSEFFVFECYCIGDTMIDDSKETGVGGTDNPDRIFRTQAVPPSIQEAITRMVLDKGLPIILCLIAIYYLFTTLMTQIPKHIEAITSGIKQIADEDRIARHEDVAKHLEAVKTVVDGAKDSQDRLERILSNKVNIVERKVKEVEKKTEGMEVN